LRICANPLIPLGTQMLGFAAKSLIALRTT
jgi:hypothetical protein